MTGQHVSQWIEIEVDGRALQVAAGQTLAAAMLTAGVTTFRRSVSGEARGPLCGMGICHECRLAVDGVRHRRACLEPVVHGMRVSTRD